MAYHLRPRNHRKTSHEDMKRGPPDTSELDEEIDSESETELEDDEEDPDYDPDAPSEEEETEEEDDEDVDEEELEDIVALGRNYRLGTSAPPILFLCPPENTRAPSRTKPFSGTKYSKEEKEYLTRIAEEERQKLLQVESSLGNVIAKELIPLRFRVLSLPVEDSVKRILLNKVDLFSRMNEESGEYFKLRTWLENMCMLPFQKYVQIPVSKQDPVDKIVAFMNHTKNILDQTVYGHLEAKQQILRILAQWISNPSAHGHCIGIHGPPGVGKTSLIKEGLSKALGIPFGFITLGGASDGSFLEGHSYTYEGSTYGKISEVLMKTQCNNPIFFFDELDKVSSTKKGEEIISILTHLTDLSQNETFHDKYFGEIHMNMSKCLIIFSYNEEQAINPILKDRLSTIKVEGYKKPEKLIIARDYLLPQILKNYGFETHDVLFPQDILEHIIEICPEEQGVRNMKRGLECVVSWVNMYRYLPPSTETLTFPFTVHSTFIEKHLKKGEEEMLEQRIRQSMYI